MAAQRRWRVGRRTFLHHSTSACRQQQQQPAAAGEEEAPPDDWNFPETIQIESMMFKWPQATPTSTWAARCPLTTRPGGI